MKMWRYPDIQPWALGLQCNISPANAVTFNTCLPSEECFAFNLCNSHCGSTECSRKTSKTAVMNVPKVRAETCARLRQGWRKEMWMEIMDNLDSTPVKLDGLQVNKDFN